MAKKKRRYTHTKGKLVPVEHGSMIDIIEHELSPSFRSYKTKRKKRG